MPRPVIHDNDGHVDDLLSALLLWLAPEIDLQAVTITDGDCYVQQAFEAMIKMATFLDLDGAEVALSEEPMPNPFPENWRRESFVINELPIFSEISLKKPHQSGRPRKSQALIADILNNTRHPVTLVTTGPLTNVAAVFRDRPELCEKVEECILMAGAVNVPGNVDQPDHDGTAEWNVYADPVAAKRFFDTGVPMRFIPLDVTNQVPVTPEFLERLNQQADKYRASLLASKLYSLVKGFNYFFWDTLTAAAAIKEDLFTWKDVRMDITAHGRSAGKTASVLFGGRKVRVATDLDKAGFEEVFLSTLRQ